ncbi:zinc metallopeptidase, partial [bacterium]|nr:zinc metallopeptidase [bacterium]
MFFYDPVMMMIMLFMMVIMGLASQGVKNAFNKYSQVPIRSRMTGAQAARYILDANGLQNVAIERVNGQLTDHYDPQKRVLRLSSVVYDQPSIASVGVAAHETGHALQHKYGYAPLMMRQAFYPLSSIGSNLGIWLI